MGIVFHIPWVKGVIIPWVGSSIYYWEGVKVPWVGESINH
jgi:hypothetical protein